MRLEDEIKQPLFKHPFEKAILNIRFTNGWLDQIILSVLKQYGLSEEQYNVLRILKGQYPNPSPLQLISGRMLNRMSNVTRLVEKLRRSGLVSREVCPANRRKVDILITQKGLSLLDEVAPQLEDQLRQQQHVTAEEVTELNRILDKFRGPNSCNNDKAS
ncbi:MAG: MarR family transcriptional regulator [Tunicatimonas sp.]